MDTHRDQAREHGIELLDAPELRAMERRFPGARDARHLALTDRLDKGGTQHDHQSEKQANARHAQTLVGGARAWSFQRFTTQC
ncbi:hypothetical protein GCM10023075_73340 [Streptosporangium album]